MKVPYIGVIDFKSFAQVVSAQNIFAKKVTDQSRRLHVGAMVSYKTLHSIPTEKGWENVWLSEEGLNHLFATSDVFNVIHYTDILPYPKTKTEDLLEAIRRSGKHVSGLQINMLWPEPDLITEVKSKHPNLEIIVQVSYAALKKAQAATSTTSLIKKYFDAYKKSGADYILIDLGAGQRGRLVKDTALKYISVCREVFDETSIALAGGLGPSSMCLLEPILEVFPLISWEAQNALRKSFDPRDDIEMDRVMLYLKRSLKISQKYRSVHHL